MSSLYFTPGNKYPGPTLSSFILPNYILKKYPKKINPKKKIDSDIKLAL